MANKETMQPFQFGSQNSYFSSCGINFKHVMMYPGGRPEAQNIGSVKIMKFANMWGEMKVFVKNWEGSVPQSVAIATAKTR